MVAVAKQLGARARRREDVFGRLTLAPDFVVFMGDPDHELDRVRRSVPAVTFARLFPPPRQVRRARPKAPEGDALRALVARFARKPIDRVACERTSNQLALIGAKAVPAPRSYACLEKAIPRLDARARTELGKLLAPDRGAYTPAPADVPVLARVAGSRHEVLRVGAAVALGHRSLGKAARPRAVAILVRLLADGAPEVRRSGRASAKDAVPTLRALAETEESKRVRDAVKSAIAKLA